MSQGHLSHEELEGPMKYKATSMSHMPFFELL